MQVYPVVHDTSCTSFVVDSVPTIDNGHVLYSNSTLTWDDDSDTHTASVTITQGTSTSGTGDDATVMYMLQVGVEETAFAGDSIRVDMLIQDEAQPSDSSTTNMVWLEYVLGPNDQIAQFWERYPLQCPSDGCTDTASIQAAITASTTMTTQS